MLNRIRKFIRNNEAPTMIITVSLILAAIILITSDGCHAAVAGKQKNSFGAVIDYSNPNVYIFGAVADGAVFKDEHQKVLTNVRFQPYNTFALYTESVLFCGDVSNLFYHGAIVVTYKRRAHEASGGIGCHELVSVNKVEDKKGEE